MLNQHRLAPGFENVPKRPLIAVVKIAGVLDIERESIQQTKVGETFVQQPDQHQLRAVQGVVKVIITE